MWTTTIYHSEAGVAGMVHDFGNEVSVVTDFAGKTTKQLHGKVVVTEIEMISDIACYSRYLHNIDRELNGPAAMERIRELGQKITELTEWLQANDTDVEGYDDVFFDLQDIEREWNVLKAEWIYLKK